MKPKKKTDNTTLYIFLGVMCVIFLFLFSMQYSVVKNQNPNENGLDIIFAAFERLQSAPTDFTGASFSTAISMFLVLGGIAAFAAYYYYLEEKRKVHIDPFISQGSAEWNSDFKKFKKDNTICDKKGKPTEQNMILAKDLLLGIKEKENVNVMIIGSAGSGKSFGVIKPNILQANTSLIVTDPSGELFRAEAKFLMERGYDVKIFSTSSMECSNVYNPFDYVYDEFGAIDENRVTSMITMFMANATDLKNNGKGDPFWDKSSKALLTACALLLLEFYPPETHNMYHMLVLVQKGKTSESNSDQQTELGKLFEAAEKKNPEAKCLSSYKTFALAPARTANSILISAGVDLNMFSQTKVRNMTTTAYQVQTANNAGRIIKYRRNSKGELIRTDQNIDIRTVGDNKTAIFVNIPQADGTFNFLVSMMYSQLFDSLYGRAEKICPKKWMIMGQDGYPLVTMLDSEKDAQLASTIYANAHIVENQERGRDVYYLVNPKAGEKFTYPGYNDGYLRKVYSKEIAQKYIDACKEPVIKRGAERLPWHVQFLLDEFANIGRIPEFDKKLATMRKYEISCQIVLQSRSQLETMYDKDWNGIMSNCDTKIFLGTTDYDTCEWISKQLGEKTVRVVTHGTSNSGRGKSGSTNEQFQRRALLTPDEVSKISNKDCIVMTKKGGQPFYVPKFKASDHENWEASGDVDPSMKIEPTEYTECTEKASAKSIEEKIFVEALKAASDAATANGGARKAVGLHSKREAEKFERNHAATAKKPVGAGTSGGSENYVVEDEDKFPTVPIIGKK